MGRAWRQRNRVGLRGPGFGTRPSPLTALWENPYILPMRTAPTLNFDYSMRETKRYPSPGRCIYCGRSDLPLEDEHIIPFALAGDTMIFEKASCRSCAKIINDEFENYCLRTTLGSFRARAGTPTRNKADRDKERPVKMARLDDNGNPIEVHSWTMPPEHLPLMLLSWRLPPPGIFLVGREPSEEILGEGWARFDEDEAHAYISVFRDLTGHTGNVGLNVAKLDPPRYFRFLAKTAHALAVADFGYDAFEHLLPDIILGRSKSYCHLIGGEMEVPEPEENEISCRCVLGEFAGDDDVLVAVKIQLFPMYGSPIHDVVVGRRALTQADIEERRRS